MNKKMETKNDCEEIKKAYYMKTFSTIVRRNLPIALMIGVAMR